MVSADLATFASGIMLAFILPMIPTLRFIFGVLGWVALVFIGVMGMPLFALGHLKMGGEGWFGQLQVASAYNMVLGIIIRPTLIVIGLIAGITLFNLFVKLAAALLLGAMTDVTDAHSLSNNFIDFGAVGVISLFTSPTLLASLIPVLASAVIKLVIGVVVVDGGWWMVVR